jgi:hypothetical protein
MMKLLFAFFLLTAAFCLAAFDAPLVTYKGVPGPVTFGVPFKQGAVKENSRFDDLGQAVPEDLFGQSGKAISVAQHQTGLAESTGQIFARRQINGGFSAYAGVYRCQ